MSATCKRTLLSLHVELRTFEAMYATMGYIVPEYFKFPGYLSPSLGLKFSDVPNGLAALSKLPSQFAVFAWVLVAKMLLERAAAFVKQEQTATCKAASSWRCSNHCFLWAD